MKGVAAWELAAINSPYSTSSYNSLYTNYQNYAIFDRKMILKNKFKNRFSKPKTGFRFSNRISGSLVTSLVLMGF